MGERDARCEGGGRMGERDARCEPQPSSDVLVSAMFWRELFAMLIVAAMLAVACGFGFWLASLLGHP
jgi:hypothetical protein